MSKPVKLPSGRWRVRWFDSRGERQSKTFKTQDLARSFLRRAEVAVEEIEAGRARPLSDQTIAEVAPGWLATRAPKESDSDIGRKKRKANRHRDNKCHLELHIVPALGSLRLPEVTDDVIKEFVRDLEATRTRRLKEKNIEGRTLGTSTIRNIVTTLRKMMRDLGYRVSASIKVEETGYAWIQDKADVSRFLDATSGWFAIAARLAIYAGLRKGEIGALRWTDVDFEREVIVVARSWDTPTKGNKSRTVPLPPELASSLKRWRMESGGIGGGLVVHRDGRALKQADGLAEFTQRACRKAGIVEVTLHQLRHSYASHAGETLPVPRLQAILGHASITTTMRYCHTSQDAAARDPRARLSFATETAEVVRLPGHVVATGAEAG